MNSGMNEKDIEEYWSNVRNWEAYVESYFSEDENAKPHLRSKWFASLLKDVEFESIFEVGSNCGRNLYHIKKTFPGVRVGGIDINKDAVKFAQHKVGGDFYCGSLYDLEKVLKGRKYDIVFSMAVICFVKPDKLCEVLKGLLSLAGKRIYHFEHFGDGSEFTGETSSQLYWVNDVKGVYESLGYSCREVVIPDEFKAPACESGIVVEL